MTRRASLDGFDSIRFLYRYNELKRMGYQPSEILEIISQDELNEHQQELDDELIQQQEEGQ